jgi:shikimate kinase
MKNSNILLIGPMGAGKTTIGRLLAKNLGFLFLDTDKEIERKTGASIPLFFEYEGEVGFRKRESEVIEDLLKLEPIVLATGGGSVLLPENRLRLQASGFIVYLYCPVEKQLERTHKDPNRPLLKTDNPQKKLMELFEVRDPIYRQLADYVVDTGLSSSRHVVKQIIKAYERKC